MAEHGSKIFLNKLFERLQGLDISWPIFVGSSGPARVGDAENLNNEMCRFDTFICAFDEAATNLRRLRNQFAPIYRFPPEVLCLIIESAIDVGAVSKGETISEMYHKYYQGVRRLGGVSSFFRTTVISNSQFWTKIDGNFRPQFLELILQRSKNGPLDINIEYEKVHAPYERSGVGFVIPNGETFPLILEYCSRWRSFRMATSSFRDSYNPQLPECLLPLLESLEICRDTFLPQELSAWARQRAPKLSHLDITPFSFPLGCKSLTTLRSIRMTSTISGVPLSPSQWHSFLSSSPQLKSIFAHGFSIIPFNSREPWVTKIHMPNLENLELRYQPLTLVGGLLRSIIPAPNSYPRITIEVGDMTDGEWIHAFPEFLPDGSLLSKIIRRIEWMEWIKAPPSGPRDMLLKGGMNGSGQSVTIHVPHTAPDVTQILLPSFGAPFLVSVEINDSRLFDGGYIISGIRFCSRLERLVLGGIGMDKYNQDRLSQLCTALATPLQPSVGSGVVAWPCPNLRDLEICGTITHFPFVLQLIQTRYGAIKGTDHPPPVFLEKLRLTTFGPAIDIRSQSPEAVKQLEKVLKRHGTTLMLE